MTAKRFYTHSSFLSKLNRKVNWYLGFQLHTINPSEELELSQKTYWLLYHRSKITDKLKASIKEDYETQRAKILAEREAEIKAFNLRIK